MKKLSRARALAFSLSFALALSLGSAPFSYADEQADAPATAIVQTEPTDTDPSVDPSTGEPLEGPAPLDRAGETPFPAESTDAENEASALASASIAEASVSPIQTRYQDGEAHEPKPKVKLNGKVLALNTDYTLSYANNVYKGTGTVTIKGTGSYHGSKTVSFEILGDGGSSVWHRLAGPTALDTMSSIVQKGFETGAGGAVVVATMGGYWDALTASGLAGQKNAPVLLTDGKRLSEQAASEIRRLGATTAYIVGGTAAVSSDVARQIKAAGCANVVRYAGATAVGTAEEIFKGASSGWGDTCVIATSSTFQDALSIAPYAYARTMPIFLADEQNRLSERTASLVKSKGFERAVIVGGPAAVSSAVENQLKASGIPSSAIERLGGATCYETSTAIANWELSQGMKAESMAVATGTDYYDALTGAALCGKKASVLVLVSDDNRTCIRDVYAPRMTEVSTAYVFGGEAAVSQASWDYTLCGGMRWDSSPCSEANKKLEGLVYAYDFEFGTGGGIPVAPKGGINWNRDLVETHKWTSRDIGATLWNSFGGWEGDTDGAMPPRDSSLFTAYSLYQNDIPVDMGGFDRKKYPIMRDFASWRDRYLNLSVYYSLYDPYIEESCAPLGITFSGPDSRGIEKEDLYKTPRFYPAASYEDVTVPPIEGAVLHFNGRLYEEDFVVSYFDTGNLGAYGSISVGWEVRVPL